MALLFSIVLVVRVVIVRTAAVQLRTEGHFWALIGGCSADLAGRGLRASIGRCCLDRSISVVVVQE